MLSLAKFVGFPSQEWIILHPKLYAYYNYVDCNQKNFAKFEYTVSSERVEHSLLTQ